MILGIDFGTCYSMSVVMQGNLALTSFVSDRIDSSGVPSLMMYSDDQKTELFGDDCNKMEGTMHPQQVIRYVKRRIREKPDFNATVKSYNRVYTLREVVKMYLKDLIDKTMNNAIKSGLFEKRDEKLERIAITAPLGISDGNMTSIKYKDLLREVIVELYGLEDDKISIVDEPVAAAIGYLYRENLNVKYTDNETILVFDLGGGTLDVTAVEFCPKTNEYNVISKHGDLYLGGNDWDKKFMDYIIKRCDIMDDFTDEGEKYTFMRKVTDAKEILNKTKTLYAFTAKKGGKLIWPIEITLEEFDACTRSLLDKAMKIVDDTISDVGSISDIDKIILVGGSSQMLQVKKCMDDRYGSIVGEDNIMVFEPSLAIARGAGYYAKKNADWQREANKNRQAVDNSIIVNDIASHTYGIDCEHKDEAYIYNMIFKDTPFVDGKISVVSQNAFYALRDDQQETVWNVYESDKKISECENGRWIKRTKNYESNGMRVVVPIPEEYYTQNKSKERKHYAKLVLNNNGILELTVLDEHGNQLGYTNKKV